MTISPPFFFQTVNIRQSIVRIWWWRMGSLFISNSGLCTVARDLILFVQVRFHISAATLLSNVSQSDSRNMETHFASQDEGWKMNTHLNNPYEMTSHCGLCYRYSMESIQCFMPYYVILDRAVRGPDCAFKQCIVDDVDIQNAFKHLIVIYSFWWNKFISSPEMELDQVSNTRTNTNPCAVFVRNVCTGRFCFHFFIGLDNEWPGAFYVHG